MGKVASFYFEIGVIDLLRGFSVLLWMKGVYHTLSCAVLYVVDSF